MHFFKKSVLASRILLVFSLLLFGTTVHAQSRDIDGASDFAGLNRFPGSQIVDYRRAENTNYTLVLGRMQRVNGRVTPGNSERLQGRLTRITYDIPSGFTADDVFRHFRQQLLAVTETALFTCQGRDCGSSNFWANEVFGNRILYGPEANQYYVASNLQSAQLQSNTYIAAYVVTRANRRVYAHLDILELSTDREPDIATSPEALLIQLNRDGSVVLPDISFDSTDNLVDDAGIQLVLQVLRREPLMQVYIVGHLQAGSDLGTMMERSAQRADTVRQVLLAEGIAGDRVLAQGVGPLAPSCNGADCAQRIELVLRR